MEQKYVDKIMKVMGEFKLIIDYETYNAVEKELLYLK